MITGKDIYEVMETIIPMYFALTLAYISVKWLKIFTAEQCNGINGFLRVFAIPFLSFRAISSNNLYTINFKLFAADSLQKITLLFLLFIWKSSSQKNSLEWMITLFALSSLPNTLIMGLPIAKSMYGDESVSYMIQTLVFQTVIWINVLIILYEYRAAKVLVLSQNFAAARGGPPGGVNDDDDDGGGAVVHQTEISVSGEVAGAEVGVDDDDGSTKSWGKFDASNKDAQFQTKDEENAAKNEGFVEGSGMIKLILYMVWKKVSKNPNAYASLLGLLWSLISFKCNIQMPIILSKSIYLLSDTGRALSMFSLGTFMASQPNIITCSIWEAVCVLVARFLVSPIVITATSKIVGLQGIAFHTAVLQAAFPQSVLCFVFAKEYNVHPNVLSTSIVAGMLVALPIILLYYLLLGAIFK